MVTRTFVLLLLWTAGSMCAAECRVLYRKDAASVSAVALIAGSLSFSEREALECFRDFVAKEKKQVRLRSVRIYSDAEDQACCRYRMAEVRSFRGWLVAVEAAHKVQGAMAEVVQSPAGIALRYRSVSGQVSKRVIEGRDPTEVRAGRSRFEILYSFLIGPVPAYEDKPDGGYRLDVFLRSDGPLREDDCLRATQNLAKDFDIPLVYAAFRRDPFFVLSDTYPLLNPLVELSRLPTEQEYLAHGQMGCFAEYGETWCARRPGLLDDSQE
jgi:hypothetical protein